MMSNPIVSVIVPTMNEERAVDNCITTIFGVFATRNMDGEVIVVDSSQDRTPEIAESLGARVIRAPKSGYSNAIVYGIEQARGLYIVMGDADRSYDFTMIPSLVYPLMRGETDLVLGSRLNGRMMKGAMPPLHRYVGNPLITWILNKKLGTHVSDAHCGIRAFTKELWDKIDNRLMAEDFCSEMLKQVAKHKARIMEIPISYFPRDGHTKVNTIVHGYRCFKFLAVHVIFEK